MLMVHFSPHHLFLSPMPEAREEAGDVPKILLAQNLPVYTVWLFHSVESSFGVQCMTKDWIRLLYIH